MAKEAKPKYKKHYVGKGKKVEGTGIVKINFDMEKSLESITVFKGKKYGHLEIAPLKNSDEYGNTHTVYFNEKLAPTQKS